MHIWAKGLTSFVSLTRRKEHMFREFAMKGNVLDVPIGSIKSLILKITTSLVYGANMPLIGFRHLLIAGLAVCLMAPAIPAIAQTQAAATPPKVYTGSFGAGLAITGGNTSTKTFNLSFDLTRDPKTKNVIKANALYIRSNANGVATGKGDRSFAATKTG